MTVGPVTADGRACVLADGNQMPMLGLGVWQVPNGPEWVNAVRWALDLGYRHIDTAQAYRKRVRPQIGSVLQAGRFADALLH
jgi:diketogulonate reductase-like aldo/keto reductase